MADTQKASVEAARKREDFRQEVIKKLKDLTGVIWNVSFSPNIINKRYELNINSLLAPEVTIAVFVAEKDINMSEFLNDSIMVIVEKYRVRQKETIK